MVAVAGAGLQIAGYTDRWWGNALLIAATALAVLGVASLWIQQYIELRAARTSLRHKFPENQLEITQLHQQNEKLVKRLRRTEQERDKLREKLADPTAMRRHNEQILQRRCLEVAQELENFMRGRGYASPDETVAAFTQRHEWKVNQLRDELRKQGWLTVQERDILTFRDGAPPHIIVAMAATLKDIGMGH